MVCSVSFKEPYCGCTYGQLTPHQVLVGSQDELLLSDCTLPSLQRQWQAAGVSPSLEDLAYLAPEQVQGVTFPASDQYALGVMVYEWLTGQRPFRGLRIPGITSTPLRPCQRWASTTRAYRLH